MRARRPTVSRHGQELRMALGVTGVVVTGLAVHDHTLSPVETAVFRAVNQLPDPLYKPGWVVMQAGNVVAAPVAGALALGAGRPRMAARLTVTGLITWTLAKLIKRFYRRPRPAYLIADVRCRGKEPSGLGYVSGHAGIAAGIAVGILPVLRTPARLATAAAASVVGLCRIYVGAHLPLDVVGGAALGLAVEAAVSSVIPDDVPATSSDLAGEPQRARSGCARPATSGRST